MNDPSKTYNIVFSNNDCEESVTLQATSDSINWQMSLGTTAGLFVRHDLSHAEAMAEIWNLVDLLLKTRYNTTENNSNASALKTLQQCGLNPQVYDTIEKAAEGVAELIENLREQLNDPDHHTQTLVLKKLQIWGFCENPKL